VVIAIFLELEPKTVNISVTSALLTPELADRCNITGKLTTVSQIFVAST
jgi:hypothetical protein